MSATYGLRAGLLIAAAVLLTGCQGIKNGTEASAMTLQVDLPGDPGAVPSQTEETGINVDAELAEAVSVYYGSICYSFYSEEPDTIKQIADLFHGFTLEEAPEGELDYETTFQVYFSADEAQVAAVNVDKNGMFYLPEEQRFYRISKGAFPFDQLYTWYQESMNSNGFESLRPLDS